MGWPVLIGLALSAAGAGAGAIAANKSRKEMDDAALAELQRQQKYQGRATKTFDESLDKSGVGTAKKTISAGEQQANETYQRLQSVPLDVNDPTPQKQYGIVNAKTNAARTGLGNQQQAAMQGIPQWLQQQQIKNLLAAADQGFIGNQAAASARVNPLEIQAASHEGDSLGALGSMLGTAGSLTTMFGGMAKKATLPLQKGWMNTGVNPPMFLGLGGGR